MTKVINPKTTLFHLNKQMIDKNTAPGTLFKYTWTNESLLVVTMNIPINENGYVESFIGNGAYDFVRIPTGDCLVYLDAIYNPYTCKHYLRFLYGEKIVGLNFVKGKTFARLRTRFKVLHPGARPEKKTINK